MQVQFILIALASYLSLCQGQSEDALVAYLNQLGAGDLNTQDYLSRVLSPNNIETVVDCLISRGQLQGCDPRSNAVRRVIPLLNRTRMQCRSCSPPVQNTINGFVNAIRNSPSACNRLSRELQIPFDRLCKAF